MALPLPDFLAPPKKEHGLPILQLRAGALMRERNGIDKLRQVAETFWREEYADRNGVVVDYDRLVVPETHNHKEGEEPNGFCIGCHVASAKKPIIRHRLLVERDKENRPMVMAPMRARKHNPNKGSASYHKRVQKKWVKRAAGKQELQVERERVYVILSSIQLDMIRKYEIRRAKLHYPYVLPDMTAWDTTDD